MLLQFGNELIHAPRTDTAAFTAERVLQEFDFGKEGAKGLQGVLNFFHRCLFRMWGLGENHLPNEGYGVMDELEDESQRRLTGLLFGRSGIFSND